MKERIRRNKFLAFAISMTSAVTTMGISGTLMQTFLAKLGLSTNLIYIHSTVALAVNVAALVLSSRWVAPHNVI